nr:polysaccharide biosynthesis/export family protein [Paraburkholderia phosphatilytica]
MEAPQPYLLGAGDVRQITVCDHPELAAALGAPGQSQVRPADAPAGFIVDQSGDIQFPYAGSLHVAGLRSEHMRELLPHRLERLYKAPQVTVRVASYRSAQISRMGRLQYLQIERRSRKKTHCLKLEQANKPQDDFLSILDNLPDTPAHFGKQRPRIDAALVPVVEDELHAVAHRLNTRHVDRAEIGGRRSLRETSAGRTGALRAQHREGQLDGASVRPGKHEPTRAAIDTDSYRRI